MNEDSWEVEGMCYMYMSVGRGVDLSVRDEEEEFARWWGGRSQGTGGGVYTGLIKEEGLGSDSGEYGKGRENDE